MDSKPDDERGAAGLEVVAVNGFFDDEFRRWAISQYEEIRKRRKSMKRKPDSYDEIEIALDRIFEPFYKQIIGH